MAFHPVEQVPHPHNEGETAAVAVPVQPKTAAGACTRKLVVGSVLIAAAVIAIVLASLAAAGVLWGSPDCNDSDEGEAGEPIVVTYDSCGALYTDLRKGQCNWYSNSVSLNRGGDFAVAEAMAASGDAGTGAKSSSAPSAPPSSGGDSPDFSGTNNQVEGIDESDIVKTDGKYIYTVSRGAPWRLGVQSMLTISKAHPVNEATILARVPLGRDFAMQPNEMFLDGDRLLVFGYSNHRFTITEGGVSVSSTASYGYYAYRRNLRGGQAEGAAASGRRLGQVMNTDDVDTESRYGTFSVGATTMLLLDVADRTSPKVMRRVDLEGSFVTARKIGKRAFVVTNSWPHYWARAMETSAVAEPDLLPLFRDSASPAVSAESKHANDDARGGGSIAGFSPVCSCTAVSRVSTTKVQSFVTVASISMAKGDEFAYVKTKTVAGRGSSVYAADDMVFLASSNWNWMSPTTSVLAFKVPIGAAAGTSDDSDTKASGWTGDAVSSIQLRGLMRAPGNILNQFSMDLYKSTFRIATTARALKSQVPSLQQGDTDAGGAGLTPLIPEQTRGNDPGDILPTTRRSDGVDWRDTVSVNNLYTFDVSRRTTLEADALALAALQLKWAKMGVEPSDEAGSDGGSGSGSGGGGSGGDLNLAGKSARLPLIGGLQGLAPGERIYSVRFVGPRAYMVTFRTVDPLFVIALADPANPRVLGELKLPGFSQYLHPVNETHLIGIGRDTQTDTWNGRERVIPLGVKMSLFDASNVSAPREAFNVLIGERGSYSEALNDHKAFLFDGKTGLTAFPISLSLLYAPSGRTYGYQVVNGLIAFTMTDTGFHARTIISHDKFWLQPGESNTTDTEGGLYDDDYYGSQPTSVLPTPLPIVEGNATEAMASLHQWGRDVLAQRALEKGTTRMYVSSDYNRRIRRSLFIGDALWTVSDRELQAVSRTTWAREAKLQFFEDLNVDGVSTKLAPPPEAPTL